MIVVASKPGQLANRLFVFAHFIAYSRRFGRSVADLAFSDYQHHFEGTKDDGLCRYPRVARGPGFAWGKAAYWLAEKLAAVVSRLPGATRLVPVVRLGWRQVLPLDTRFDARVKGFPLAIVQGWLFSAEEELDGSAELIREFFTPVPSVAARVEDVAGKAREGADILVGVHVRQGDYREFLHGKYYFPEEVYISYMDDVANLFGGQRVRFLICSNVVLAPEAFGERDFLFGSEDEVVDLYSLARCDFLMGPPSTYSIWASFYGEVPLWMIESSEERPSLDRFEVRRSQFDFPEVRDLLGTTASATEGFYR